MRPGRLRIFLGAAPGAGTTYAMLREGQRLRPDTDVVVAFCESHGRAGTVRLLEGLEVVAPRTVRDETGSNVEMDLDAVLSRRPRVALVDDLAHTNSAGSRHRKRWQDVALLLEAGIDVVSTVGIQHLESLRDAVQAITGVAPTDSVPDRVVRDAQVELVDVTPERLRRRVAAGQVYPAAQVDAALANYFRPGNLAALRELALLWLADQVDEVLQRYRVDHGIDSTWPTRERVVVALTGGPEGPALLRRGARIASRGAGGELLAVYVGAPDGSQPAADPGRVAALRQMTVELGGQFHSVTGDDIPQAILDFALSVNATQIVIGASSRPRWRRVLNPGTGPAVVARSGDIDVHVVNHEYSHERRSRHVAPRLSGLRLRAGWAMAVLGPVLLTAAMLAPPVHFDLRLIVQVFLAYVVLVALVGGLWPAVVTAVLSSLAFNWFFTHPRRTWTIDDPQNAAAIVLFLVVAVAVASVVHLNVRRTAQAVQAQRESMLFGELANSLLASPAQLDLLLSRAVSAFRCEGAAVLRTAGVRHPEVVASSGRVGPAADLPEAGIAGRERIDDEHELVLVGPVLSGSDRRLLTAYAANASAILARRELVSSASKAEALARDNRARNALLSAVSHDLRTPLAGIKAAASGLRDDSVEFAPEDERELLRTIDECSDELEALISGLLDVSRLQAGALTAHPRPLELTDALPAKGWPDRVHVEPSLAHTTVLADRELLERVVANLVDNALAHAGAGAAIEVAAVPAQDRVRLIVRDNGPGVPDDAREAMFAPFQRQTDTRTGGVGLGLAIARGLVEAMDGTLSAVPTPGGGLTMIVDLPRGDRPVTTEAPA